MSDLFSCASCKYNDGQKCTMFGRVIGMHGCSNGEQRKPKTNGDKIRAMTDEELAELLEVPDCANCYAYLINCDRRQTSRANCVGKVLEWLKQEVDHAENT